MKPLVLLILLMTLVAPGCKKKPQSAPVDSPTPNTNTGPGGGNPVGVVPTPVGGGGIVTNTGGVGGGGGGGGGVMAAHKAARRAAAMNEMKNIGEIIEGMRDEFGKMPTKEAILMELKKTPKLLAGVEEGAYILTGTMEGGGLWLYEVDSEILGGIVVIGGRATRANVDEVKQYLRR